MTSLSALAAKKRIGIIGALGALFLCLPGSSMAAGALAVGLPPDVANAGFTYGFSIDHPNDQGAREEALQQCRTTKDAAHDEKLRSLCTIITTFKNQCVAVAMDPRNGTPGVGWAVAQDRSAAESQALEKCRQTDGAELQAACVVDHAGCDGAR
jgi:hypothetical protein